MVTVCYRTSRTTRDHYDKPAAIQNEPLLRQIKFLLVKQDLQQLTTFQWRTHTNAHCQALRLRLIDYDDEARPGGEGVPERNFLLISLRTLLRASRLLAGADYSPHYWRRGTKRHPSAKRPCPNN